MAGYRYPEMNWSVHDRELGEEFKLLREHMSLCLEDNEVTADEKATTKIKIALGNEGLHSSIRPH